MSLIVKLFIASLFSIHQYIPDEDTRYKKYYTDVRQASPEDVIPAAHEACRYLISVFVTAGLETTMGSSNPLLSSSLANVFGGDQGLDSVLGSLTTGPFAKKFQENNIDPAEITTVIKNICSVNYSPLSFTPEQRQEAYDFIQSEINVLSDVHLNSLGDFNYFGSVNIFDRAGQTIGTIDAVPRAWVPYDKMSPQLSLALLATEDEDFFSHRGVDSKAIARIIKEMLTGDDNATGGSTVTMQLLKNMYFLNGPKSQYEDLNSGTFSTILRKVREWYWAWPYEKEHARVLGDLSAKKYVLEMYFNLVDFGPRIQGIEQASYVYFSKSADQLDLAESAFITTLLKAPSRYSNPDNYVEWSEPRRNDYILNRAGGICTEVQNRQDSQYESIAMADLFKKICTSGKDPIDAAYIQKSKEQSLPLWIRPTSAPVSTPMIMVRNQVADWIKSNKLDPESRPKEISVQTTIKQELQDIVFDVVRKKVDEYDGVRTSNASAVAAANDDTGRQAQFRSTDINNRLNSQINAIIGKNKDTSVKYFSTVKFRPTKLIGSQTVSFQDITAYISGLSTPPDEIAKYLNTLSKALVSNITKVGDVYLIGFKGLDYEIIPIDVFVNERLDLTAEEKASLLAPMDRTTIRNQIMTTALSRMDRVKPRDYMRVGVISENGNLVNSSLEAIKLTEAAAARVRRFSFGDFFWLRPQNLEASREAQDSGVFLLDTPKLQAAVMVMDTNNGEVLANFGGYDPLASSFNRSKDAYRQAGSTLKPWIYYYALNKGFNPQDIINNRYISFEVPGRRAPYVPKNYSSSLNGNISFAVSLTNSQNIGTYSLIKDEHWGPDWRTNLDELRSFFEMIGLYGTANKEVTIMLGSQEITIEKLVSSFSFFANGTGIANPQYIKYVTDYKGNKLYEAEPRFTTVPVYKNDSIFQIQTLMAETTNSGTAARMNAFVKKLSDGKYAESCYNDVIGAGKQACFGGKTGTSNDAKDVWFIGFTKNFVIGIWLGYDDPKAIGSTATGGGLALPIFQDIVAQGEEYLPKIEPFITNESAPRSLERRVTYGSQSCPVGSSNPMVQYADYYSAQNNCSAGQPAPAAAATPSPAAPSAANRCDCVSRGYQYSLQVTTNGVVHRDVVVTNTLNECERSKPRVQSQSGVRLCY